jgi:hypothetical protein
VRAASARWDAAGGAPRARTAAALLLALHSMRPAGSTRAESYAFGREARAPASSQHGSRVM